MSSANRVLSNTLILYIRVIITAGITLYSTRLILEALGEVDYGIFSLISGVVIMLAFLNNALANSTQRFLSYSQGKKDILNQKKIFSNSFLIHITLGLIIVLTLQLTKFFLFDDFLNIPLTRIDTAKVVYDIMCIDIFFTVISVPYNACLMAHENITWVALCNIFISVMKLFAAIILFYTSYDSLLFYSISIGIITFLNYFINMIYCNKKYDESTFFIVAKSIDLKIIKELGAFASWNLLAVLSGMGRTQGIPLVLNLFYGTKANAAYGISYQISGQLNFVSSSLLRALNPQIMKSEGFDDRERMLRLSLFACKTGFFLLSLIVIPFIFEIENILDLWLTKIPEFTIPFCVFVLTYFLLSQLTVGLDSAMHAIGDIKKYSILTSIVRLSTLPIGYLILSFGYGYNEFFYAFIIIEIIAGAIRLKITISKTGLEISHYYREVVLKLLFPTLICMLSCLMITKFFPISLLRLVLTFSLSIFLMLIIFYFTGLSPWEKKIILSIIYKIKNKLSF